MNNKTAQINIFGSEDNIGSIAAIKKPKTKSRRFRDAAGYDKCHECRDCEFICCMKTNGRKYYKCKKMGLTRGAGTDIRLSDTACNLFEQRKKVEQR